MIAQYIEIKTANPDCLLFYRMGDFYELFFEDAETASQALGIMLTKRGRHLGADIAMCGVPVERADDYLERLIRLGHRVAVCEQIEDPAEARKRGAKSVVRRDVVRIVTPGTLTDERLLEPRRPNVLVAVARIRRSDEDWAFGVASADISTGVCRLRECAGGDLASELARIGPSEIVATRALLDDAALNEVLRQAGAPLSNSGREAGDSAVCESKVTEYYGVTEIEGLGSYSRAELAALAVLIGYVQATQFGAPAALSPPIRESRSDFMEIDGATRANLEMVQTLGGRREGSLIHVLDQCKVAAGARLLQERLSAPLVSARLINDRLDFVSLLAEAAPLRDEIRRMLARAPDFIRALTRLTMRRGGPRDLAAISNGVAVANEVHSLLAKTPDPGRELADCLAVLATADLTMAAEIDALLCEDPPAKAPDGNFVKAGQIAALDEARALRDESRGVIAHLQGRYIEDVGIRQLRIKHNHFLGYFIELPQQLGARLLQPPFAGRFIHRQTMADAMRFQTQELSNLQTQVASAAGRALALELQAFAQMSEAVVAQQRQIKEISNALARIDVAAALAETACAWGWTRPTVDHSLNFQIEAGRHPIVEAALRRSGRSFVANDAALSDEAGGEPRIAVVTGPNMAGKSTFLRQNALIAVLAQIGSFTPARRVHLGVVDRLFSRIGAADDLARGRSTFMVEMVEAAAILNQSTRRSLVILDEIGRGTATFDGLAIAWAVIEHLHDISRPRALFATHFHELTQLAAKLPRLLNLTTRVSDWQGDLVFLHELVPGAADRSYGVQVAKLAGLPKRVVARASALLAEFEAQDRREPKTRLLEDLPLFAASSRPVAEQAPANPVADALDAVDPDGLSPREALESLYLLKKLRRAQMDGDLLRRPEGQPRKQPI